MENVFDGPSRVAGTSFAFPPRMLLARQAIEWGVAVAGATARPYMRLCDDKVTL